MRAIIVFVVPNIRLSWMNVNVQPSFASQHEYSEQILHWDNLVWSDFEVKSVKYVEIAEDK